MTTESKLTHSVAFSFRYDSDCPGAGQQKIFPPRLFLTRGRRSLCRGVDRSQTAVNRTKSDEFRRNGPFIDVPRGESDASASHVVDREAGQHGARAAASEME